MRRFAMIVVGSVLVIGAAGGLAPRWGVMTQSAVEERPGDDAKALTKLDDDWSKAAGKKDLARVTSFYAENAVVYPPNEPAAVGREAAGKIWGAFMADPAFSISWKATHAEVSGELGYTVGTYEDSYTGPEGKVVHEKGNYMCIWKKQSDGSWKAVQDMWNSDSK